MAQSALDSDITVGEPRIAQLDSVADYRVTRLLYEWKPVKDETGNVVMAIVDVKYPDIENALGYLLSHLNMVMRYSFEERCSELITTRKRIIAPLKYKYRREWDALQILRIAESICERNIKESGGGSHQEYVGRLMGSHRSVEVLQPQQQQQKRGWFR